MGSWRRFCARMCFRWFALQNQKEKTLWEPLDCFIWWTVSQWDVSQGQRSLDWLGATEEQDWTGDKITFTQKCQDAKCAFICWFAVDCCPTMQCEYEMNDLLTAGTSDCVWWWAVWASTSQNRVCLTSFALCLMHYLLLAQNSKLH